MPAFNVAYDNAIAVVTFDLPGEPVNKLTTAVMREFEELMTQLRANAGARAVVFISGKPDNFIAGADIEEFVKLQNRTEAEALSRKGQELMTLVDDFPRPVIAAIHGACLGGGYELALACHWRIATDSAKTQIGLPEVQLGIIPGAGGSVRLPRLIGARAALDIILQGRSERAQKALRLGMVDEVVPPSILREVALAAADRLAQEGKPRRHTPGGATGVFLDRTPVGRELVFRMARKQVLKKTGGNYPAPLAALDVVRGGARAGGRTRAQGGARAVRRAGRVGGVAKAGADLLRDNRTQEGRRRAARYRGRAAAHPADRDRRVGVHGLRHRGRRRAQRGGRGAAQGRRAGAGGAGASRGHGDPGRSAQAPPPHPSAAPAAHRAALRQLPTTAASPAPIS